MREAFAMGVVCCFFTVAVITVTVQEAKHPKSTWASHFVNGMFVALALVMDVASFVSFK